MSDRLRVRRARHGALARDLPVADGQFDQSGLRVVMRYDFRLLLRDVGKALYQRIADALVVAAAGALEKRLVGGVLHERVLEGVARACPEPTTVRQPRLNERVERRR